MRSERGISRLEFITVTILAGVVLVILLNRFLFYQELAEKAAVEYTISTMKSALRSQMANLLIDGRAQEFGRLAQENPMDWLETKPDDYRGKLTDQEAGPASPGSWYFDQASRTVVYLVKRGENFQPDSSGRKQVRLQVRLVKNRPAGSDDDKAADPTDTVTLVLVEPYAWF